jgi:hypothetical protein
MLLMTRGDLHKLVICNVYFWGDIGVRTDWIEQRQPRLEEGMDGG